MPFNLHIDIGSEDQKRLIEREFRLLLLKFERKYSFSEKIVNVYFPVDFQSKVRELSESVDFISIRLENRELVFGKVVYGETSDMLVISPELFTDSQDSYTRAHFYFHEFVHIYDGGYHKPIISFTKENSLTSDINSFFAEYRADRISFDLIDAFFENTSNHLMRLYVNCMAQFYENLRNKAQYQHRLRQTIGDFKNRDISFDDFALKALPIIKSFLISISHLFAYIHTDIRGIDKEKKRIAGSLQDIDLLSDKIIFLGDLFRDQYSKNNKKIPNEHVNVLDNVYRSLGLSIEDRPEGLYFGVDFI